MSPPFRRMLTDHFSLNDSVASVTLIFPIRVSPEELRDIRDWFELRCKGWQRNLIESGGAPADPSAEQGA